MNYRLAVLTHGRMSTLDDTLASFHERVTPAPAETFIHADGVFRSSITRRLHRREGCRLRVIPVARGFCHATSALWEWATDPGVDFVFWLEHDFLFLRDVDLSELAACLTADETLAQMALCRGPANREEEIAGGLVSSRPGEFEPMDATRLVDGAERLVATIPRWLRHRSYFSTNPSLMRRDFMIERPFPADGAEFCEGRYGFDLRERGYSFGLWGGGEEWVQHIGVRSGFGY